MNLETTWTGRLLLAMFSLLILPVGMVTQAHAAQQSQVQVSLVPGDDYGAVDPSDPDNPSKPYPGDSHDQGNQGTGSTGQLTIDFVSNLKFKPVTVQNGPVTTTAQNERAMVQVSDRRATGSGWSLQVTPSPLQSSRRTLSTDLTLGSLQLTPGNGNVSTAPNIVNTGSLRTGLVNNVLVAQPNTGLGTWLLVLNRGPQPATLRINDRQLVAGDYTGTLVWSLTNAPN